MRSQIAIGSLSLVLAACTSQNPYTADSAPIPPAPTELPPANIAYPAAPVDFSRYRTWQWRRPPAASGVLASETLQEIVSGQLDQQGLRPAPPGQTQNTLAVNADLRSETRVRQVYDDYGGFNGYYGYGHPGVGLYGSPGPRVRQYQEEVAVVRLEFYDAASGRLLWSNHAEARSGDTQSERQDALRDAVRRALEGFPPR